MDVREPSFNEFNRRFDMLKLKQVHLSLKLKKKIPWKWAKGKHENNAHEWKKNYVKLKA